MDQVVAAPKKFSWVPSVQEVLLFAVMMILLIIVVRLMHYTSVRKQVVKESRCAREKSQTSAGQYTLQAKTGRDEPMYKITYNLAAKQYLVECACKKGETVNAFTNIKVYDARDTYNPVRTIQKYCWCETDVSTNQKPYYDGYPSLIRFMRDGDTSLFTGKTA
jgi:hypothetical protein